jgi:hypothetical protein
MPIFEGKKIYPKEKGCVFFRRYLGLLRHQFYPTCRHSTQEKKFFLVDMSTLDTDFVLDMSTVSTTCRRHCRIF